MDIFDEEILNFWRNFEKAIGCLDDATRIEMLEGEDKAKNIEATNYVVEHEKTEMIGSLLKNELDPRITPNVRYYGMTMYQIKMDAVTNFYAN